MVEAQVTPEPNISDPGERSAFQRALDEYIQTLPEKRKSKFIVACCAQSVTPESINESMKRAEERNSQRTAKKIIKNALSPVVNVLKDYDSIVKALASADPMVTGIIWGALKVVIDGIDRFLNLFETIKKELRSLTSELQRITEYEYLYGDSAILQDLLCKSYINMLRFWSRVDKECDRCCFNAMLRAAVSFSTNKLSKIIEEIRDDADQIEKLAPLIEARKAKGERQDMLLERTETRLERVEAQKERQAARAWREDNEGDRQVERYRQICSWLGTQHVSESNLSQHRTNKAHRLSGTCDWFLEHPAYSAWQNGPGVNSNSSASTAHPSILWIHAPPGSGKSVLCSRVIEFIVDSDPTAAVVYHFYKFDQTTSALDTLRLLANQLFERYWARSHTVSEELYLKTQRSACSLENVQDLITMLVKCMPNVYFIIDGLDEECVGTRWSDASTVLDILVQLSVASPNVVHLWYSSQYRFLINEKLKMHPTLDIKDQVKTDVTYYLSRAIPELDELKASEQELKDNVLEKLQGRAEGNFLWAGLMIKALREEANSLTEMKYFIEDGLPLTLDGYYHRIFERFETPQRALASKVFALIAFARRPLKMRELREAVGLLQSEDSRSLDPADMPFIPRLRKLFAPLIEVQEGCDEDDCTCRLFHSTVRDFLLIHPDILRSNLSSKHKTADLRITPYVLADVCLLYLSQARYDQLLEMRDARWVDNSGEPVDRHQFLLYSAKYWDKHLDEVPKLNNDLHDRVKAFITSSNFQTFIQVQSLWVDSQFGVFRVVGGGERKYLRRVFPSWFSRGSSDGHILWRNYRQYLHDWKTFLNCATCENPRCDVLPYAGEIDRCWWGALGARNFLSKSEARYTTFRFQDNEDVNLNHGISQCFEGVTAAGDELKILRLVSRNQEALEFACEHWTLIGNRLPVLLRRQTIHATESATNWLLYVKASGEESMKMQVGRAQPAAFGYDCRFLRIGTEILGQDAEGQYIPLPGLSAKYNQHPSYIEEFAIRGSFTAVATRRDVTSAQIYQSGIPDREDTDDLGVVFTKMEELLSKTMPIEKWADDDDDDEVDSVSSCDSSMGPEEDDAYESWSECSTQHSDDFQFEDDMITPWAGQGSDADQNSSSDGEALEEGDDDDNQTTSSEDSNSGSEDSDIIPSAVVGYGRWHDDDEDGNWSDEVYGQQDFDESDYRAYSAYQSRGTQREPKASITVFDTSSGVPTRVFHFARTLPFMLYGSPPVIHPAKSLLVWPLSGGDVLFADFMANTFFVRMLRPSTSHTRHIFMKCHFSPCGLYLHIASLEGQRKPVSRRRRDKDTTQPPIKLALLLSTYRLSSRKTSRSPPSLVHRARIDLGSEKALSVSKLPYTLTWTPEELYFTVSESPLRVYCIRLFGIDDANATLDSQREPRVLMPQKSVFLPDTAQKREVYYFPPAVGSMTARIIIGSEARASDDQATNVKDKFFGPTEGLVVCAKKDVFGLQGVLSPPIGCYLHEERDLGGWGKSKDRSNIPEDLGIGQLDRRLEKFDPDDDCDLEPYIF